MPRSPAKPLLDGRRVLVIEDEPEVAAAVEQLLGDAGAIILGPVGTVAEALALLARDQRPDAAVLDLNLRGELALPVADRLAALGVPFVVTTGYGAIGDLTDHPRMRVLSKPYASATLAQAIERLCG